MILEKIRGLAANPRPVGVEKVTGVENTYRVRAGKFRILYSIEDQRLLLEVVRIGKREDVYRRLGSLASRTGA